MSKRPISIDDLLKDDELIPKFISKSNRDKLQQEEKQKQDQIQISRKSHNESISQRNNNHNNISPSYRIHKPISLRIRQPSKGRKFQFDWDEEEDTSENFQPLINEDDEDEEFDDILLNSQHWTTKSESDMTERDWRIFKEDYNINIKTDNGVKDVPNPLRSWKSLKPQLVSTINSLNYYEPTPIQRASIPISIKLHDVLAIAQTGSGKTLAYLLPLLDYILSIDEHFLKIEKLRNESLGLILVPTRELAIQITTEIEKFTKKLNLKVLSIIGGHQYNLSINEIETNGCDIIVATPGRLIDSLERNILSLDKNYYLILDECDRMIDMGFEKDLNKILDTLPNNEKLNQSIDGRIFHLTKRQTMMFSATMSSQIEKLALNYLTNPIKVSIGDSINGQTSSNIDQKFDYSSTENEVVKFNKLIKLIHANSNLSIIVFANFKHVVDELSTELDSKGFHNVVIHGSKNQQQRELSIEKFRSRQVKLLIATDVAARGIDIPNVGLVINYQMVKKFDEYIHRIGRTGRAGNLGKSFTFINDNDKEIFLPLKKNLNYSGIKIPDWLYNYKFE